MKVRQCRLPAEIYAKVLGEKEPKGFYHQRQTSRDERAIPVYTGMYTQFSSGLPLPRGGFLYSCSDKQGIRHLTHSARMRLRQKWTAQGSTLPYQRSLRRWFAEDKEILVVTVTSQTRVNLHTWPQPGGEWLPSQVSHTLGSSSVGPLPTGALSLSLWRQVGGTPPTASCKSGLLTNHKSEHKW